MRLDSFEKKMIIVMLIGVVMMCSGIAYTSYLIDKAGGIDSIIIEAGKNIKDISREIDKH